MFISAGVLAEHFPNAAGSIERRIEELGSGYLLSDTLPAPLFTQPFHREHISNYQVLCSQNR